MGKKKQQQIAPKEEEFSGNLGTPFADLVVDVPPPPEPPKSPEPPKPTKEELQEAELSAADKAMLAEYRQAGIMPEPITWDTSAEARKIPLRMSIQKHGHKGRIVTNVQGLEVTTFEERMDICSKIRIALGCGARFVESILELQGDQRERAGKWFEQHNFRVLK